jgi:altronate dehydratase small subunit
MTGKPVMDAIRLSVRDGVATVLRPIARGERLRIGGEGAVEMEAAEDIPLCHKIALTAHAAGDRIFKYGEPIGEAIAAIGIGAHVHIHNLRSLRARGKNSG